MAILEVENLHKTYRGRKQPALNGLSFDIAEGSVYAFVGPNGAGKTTTIRILTTLLTYDKGDVRIGEYSVKKHPRDVRRLIGYIPDEFGLYDEMLVTEYLEFFADCYDIPQEQHPRMTDDLLELVGLSHRRDDPVRSLSRGMRQRLCLARALVHDPALIIADEPAAGLDPRARVELREIFRALQEMGKTIFLSSHVLRELDEVATHVGIIEEGKLVVSGPIDEVRARLRPHRQVRITFLHGAPPAEESATEGKPSARSPIDDAQRWLSRHPSVLKVERAALTRNGDGSIPALAVTLQGGAEIVAGLLSELVGAGFPVLSYVEERETLESLFMNLTRGIVS